MHHVVIVAGGKGERMRSTLPKQFLPLGDKPVLMHTIEAFKRADATMDIVLVLHPAMREYWQELCEVHQFDLPVRLVDGGATRFHSVQNGIKVLAEVEDHAIVLVHDAVRPFVSPTLIAHVIEAARGSGAAVPAIAVNDSLRLIDQEGSSTAVDRGHYRAVQTPQAFRADILRRAYAQEYLACFTDDASVVEYHRLASIVLTEGDVANFKLTTPLDFELARIYVEQ